MKFLSSSKCHVSFFDMSVKKQTLWETHTLMWELKYHEFKNGLQKDNIADNVLLQKNHPI